MPNSRPMVSTKWMAFSCVLLGAVPVGVWGEPDLIAAAARSASRPCASEAVDARATWSGCCGSSGGLASARSDPLREACSEKTIEALARPPKEQIASLDNLRSEEEPASVLRKPSDQNFSPRWKQAQTDILPGTPAGSAAAPPPPHHKPMHHKPMQRGTRSRPHTTTKTGKSGILPGTTAPARPSYGLPGTPAAPAAPPD